MFSFLAPFKNSDSANVFPALPEAFQIFHNTVSDTGYISRGEKRKLHKHCIFHYTVKGHGEVLYNGKRYKTQAGEGFFNIVDKPNCGYGYPEDEAGPWEFVVVCFKGGNVRELTAQLMDKQVIYSLPPKEFERLCLELHTESEGIKQTFLPRLIALLCAQSGKRSPIGRKFERLVQDNILLNPKISAIAKEIGISREHLTRTVQKEFGISPAQYIAAKRFETLCLLLCGQGCEADIAEQMHFSSLSSMSAFFKKHSGLTPSVFRKNKYFLP